MITRPLGKFTWCCVAWLLCLPCNAQTLEQRLLAESPAELEAAVQLGGDPQRGAILFHQPSVGCATCHSVADDEDGSNTRLGPNLAMLGQNPDVTNQHLIESILNPSASIREGYSTVSILRNDGRIVTGLELQRDPTGGITIQDASTRQVVQLDHDDIEAISPSKLSLMPSGVVNTLGSRQQFLDLAKYVMEIRAGGPERASELQPSLDLIAFRLPQYESSVDHAGLIVSRDQASLQRGEAIYSRLCVNCHGTLRQVGSLPTALRFGEGKFRAGSDPYAMYRTLTHGFGLMVPQTWMVPQQKYDVIHYIREAFLKKHNPSQYSELTDDYLASLPQGDTFGPEPVESTPWSDMDYGPWMFNTIEVGHNATNIAYKGLAVRLDAGPGGVSRGNQWTLFDHDTMRLAAAWQASGDAPSRFIDWQGIHFDGRHQTHPHLVGDVVVANPNGPGWADPDTGSFDDDQRVQGRDGKRYGPLPKRWAHYRGMHHAGDDVIVSYRVGDMEVLEQHSAPASRVSDDVSSEPLFLRTLHLGATAHAQTLLVATEDSTDVALSGVGGDAVHFATRQPDAVAASSSTATGGRFQFDGSAWLQIDDADKLQTATSDFSVTARVQTSQDGVIFSNTSPGPKWVPDATALFLRGGRLCYDVGWVGVVSSKKNIADNRWHDIALTWKHDSGEVRLFVDGKKIARGRLAPNKPLSGAVARIGYGAANFPDPSAFGGSIRDVRFFRRALSDDEVATTPQTDDGLMGHWLANSESTTAVGPQASVVENPDFVEPPRTDLLASVGGDRQGCEFQLRKNRLCLHIPASSQSRSITLAITRPMESNQQSSATASPWQPQLERMRLAIAKIQRQPTLAERIASPARPLWPQKLTTTAELGSTNSAGFAIDTLTAPDANPWLARLRLGGLDFFADGDRMIVCTWDGDVFEVAGLSGLDTAATPPSSLSWRRIASGLFQPLGVKIVNGDVYLTCRDQMVILRDHNSDGATDFFECFNNDHQVTEHFHEFAMGLQRDDDGNFYYAKSARHALTAVVPHHGTLLKVDANGSETEIVATGFRAANGVCLNPDGSFVVTDQEGHWNPKNRINWVTPGGFYGNMFGYHDVTDASDEAMQPPLCWITNAFDRSPAELLWVDSSRWGNLNDTLLNLSYGYGKVYTVPHQHLGRPGHVQGGMCELPIPQFPTGIMRGRFHPGDGQLYVCGLFAWGSSRQEKEGGVYRIRYTGSDAAMPVTVAASPGKLSLTFSDPIDPSSLTPGPPLTAATSKPATSSRFALKVWDLKRTANYGSPHLNEREIRISEVQLSDNHRTVTLTVPELQPTWCYELRCRFRTEAGQSVERLLHGTIHALPEL